MPGRLISRTPPFDGGYVGANPAPAAIPSAERRVWNVEFGEMPGRVGRFHSALRIPKSALESLGGEIGSRLAYTQQSEGQNLPERPVQMRNVECGVRNRARACGFAYFTLRTQVPRGSHFGFSILLTFDLRFRSEKPATKNKHPKKTSFCSQKKSQIANRKSQTI